MALFKIEKGLKENLPINRSNAVEGYCYFTTNDKKFYIDIAGPNEDGSPLPAKIGVNRVCLNAARSDISNATNYGECSTDGGEQIKTVTIDDFKLVKGARILIKFANANTYVSTATKPLKLSINGEDPIPLTIRGKTESTTAVNMSNS